MPFADVLLRGGTVVDGTGSPRRSADIALADGRIAAVGALADHRAERELDVSGRIVAPGFVDIHSHADFTMLVDGRGHSSVLQGITSLVVGNCGHGVAPATPRSRALLPSIGLGWRTQWDELYTWDSFGGYLATLAGRGVGPNVFALVAHGALRLAVAGFEPRELTAAETHDLAALARDAMAEGALGFSTGLEYAPDLAATTAELSAVAREVGAADGLYATHCRNRTDRIEAAAAEAVRIAEAGGCRLQLSHFVRRPTPTPRGQMLAAVDAVRSADVTARFDVFPFDHGPTPISTFVLPMWVRDGGRDAVAERLESPAVREELLQRLDDRFTAVLDSGIAATMYVASDGADGELDGLPLGEIATRWRMTIPQACLEILRRAGRNFYDATVSERWVDDADLDFALGQDDYLVMGDGVTAGLDGPLAGHGFSLADWGYAPQLLGRVVREQGLLSLEQAVRRMSAAPAEQAGLRERGTLAPGAHADVVVFDAETVGTDVRPDRLIRVPVGVDYVFVNGTCVVDGGRPTDARPGVVGGR